MRRFRKQEDSAINPTTPTIIPRSEHAITRSNISPSALKVLYRLKDAGFNACLVGGGVRDLLLGREPKDFDVATDAHPEQIRQLFRNCRLIGRRFRLAHVVYGREVIEVATFRGQQTGGEEDDSEQAMTDEGRILRDNIYGTVEEDAWRRDFTVNALYYDIADFSVRDYVGGMADLKAGVLRLIGDPDVRYREDPVRMLRAARFAAKLGFRLDPATAEAIPRLADLLLDISPARIYEEVLKLFMSGEAVASYELLRQYGLFGQLFPETEAALAQEIDGHPQILISRALENTDTRIDEDKPVTPAFLFAALLWPPVQRRWQATAAELGDIPALLEAGAWIVTAQAGHTSLPKRFSMPMREIWSLQPRFEQISGRRPLRLVTHPRFRAAYDFLLLRGAAGEVDQKLCDWWTTFQAESPEARDHMLTASTEKKPKKRRRRRSGGAKRDAGGSADATDS
ncbi:MAG: polynucleotide adenylyltransferase PcnB [Gammaproteobacteria bacterium]|nr:polynucleotide adenylyltransferase PcnB [Gammaproteobacteria bacterium]